jgi:hypothetical protein
MPAVRRAAQSGGRGLEAAAVGAGADYVGGEVELEGAAEGLDLLGGEALLKIRLAHAQVALGGGELAEVVVGHAEGAALGGGHGLELAENAHQAGALGRGEAAEVAHAAEDAALLGGWHGVEATQAVDELALARGRKVLKGGVAAQGLHALTGRELEQALDAAAERLAAAVGARLLEAARGALEPRQSAWHAHGAAVGSKSAAATALGERGRG